jgi:hypothetical protein
MTVYNISGATLTIDADGGSGNIGAESTINPVTGGVGLNTVRVVNTSTANIATMSYTISDTSYSFANVSGATSGSGVDATFNVTVTNAGYRVDFGNPGTGYADNDTITILGTSLGGTTTANDLVLTVTVGGIGEVTGFNQSGTALWPQSSAGTITLLPSSENFIQVTKNTFVGAYFTSSSNGGNLLITPVTVVA